MLDTDGDAGAGGRGPGPRRGPGGAAGPPRRRPGRVRPDHADRGGRSDAVAAAVETHRDVRRRRDAGRRRCVRTGRRRPASPARSATGRPVRVGRDVGPDAAVADRAPPDDAGIRLAPRVDNALRTPEDPRAAALHDRRCYTVGPAVRLALAADGRGPRAPARRPAARSSPATTSRSPTSSSSARSCRGTSRSGPRRSTSTAPGCGGWCTEGAAQRPRRHRGRASRWPGRADRVRRRHPGAARAATWSASTRRAPARRTAGSTGAAPAWPGSRCWPASRSSRSA